MPARDDGRMDGPFGHLARPETSLLEAQAFDCGELLRLIKIVVESDVMSMKMMARHCVGGLALPCTDVQGAASKFLRASI